MELPLPAFDVTAALVPFAVVAVVMVVLTVLVLGLVRPRDGHPPLVTQLLLAISVVGGGSVLLLALLFVFLDPNGTSAWTWVLLAFNFMMVVPVGLWFIGHILFQDRRVADGGWLWPAAIGVAVTGSEVMMGLLFVVGGTGTVDPASAVAFGLSSVWFFWSMAGVMAPLVVWAPLSPTARAGGWSLVVAASVAPWVRPYPLVGGLAMTVVMAAAFVAFLRPLWRGTADGSEARLLLGLAMAFLAMTSAGLGVAVSNGAEPTVLAFGAAMASVMVAEVTYLLRRSYSFGPLVPSGAIVPATTPPLEAAGPRTGHPVEP